MVKIEDFESNIILLNSQAAAQEDHGDACPYPTRSHQPPQRFIEQTDL